MTSLRRLAGWMAFLSLLAVPGAAHCEPEGPSGSPQAIVAPEPSGAFWTHAAIAAQGIGHFADLSTTMFGIGAGKLSEGNPLLRPFQHSPIGMALAKGSLAAISTWLLLKVHKKHPELAKWMALGMTAGLAAATYHNWRLLQ